MKENFQVALKFVLDYEGGYSNNPDDAGGETKYGISKRAFPDLDIKNLTVQQASDIYLKHYWNACGCDKLPSPLDIVTFDTAVNLGVSRALSLLRACGGDWVDMLMRRLSYYASISKPPHIFLRGWLNRVCDLYRLAKREKNSVF